MVIPGDSAAEFVVISGTLNFLALYNALITARILLSWFPQAQSVAVLQPVRECRPNSFAPAIYRPACER